jgi:hypothetical protein
MRISRFFVVVVVACGSSPLIPAERAEPVDAAVDAPSAVTPDAEERPRPVEDPGPTTDAGGDDRIDPIDVGRTWTYRVSIFGSYPGCTAGTHTGEVLRSGERRGRAAFEIRSFCPGFGSAWYATEGDVVDLDYNGWIRVVDAPVRDGHSWRSGATTITWRDAGRVTVPAGTFDRCFRAEASVGYPSYTVFCRGIGPVKWYVKDLAGNGYEADLTEFSK